jgi:superfamily II DNA or RNA helicase
MTKNTDSNSKTSPLTEEQIIELFGSKEARWFQIAARNQVDEILEYNPIARILVHMPTGSGKTITSGLIFSSERLRKALGVKEGEKLRLLFIAHKHRLLTQAERVYADATNVELITQSIFSDIPQDVLDKGWHVACIDETHHESCTSIQYHLDNLGNHPIIGLTATPDRADGFIIKFDEIVAPITREQAVDEGWLAQTNIHSFVDVTTKDKVGIMTDIFTNFAHEMGQTLVFVKTKKEVVALTLVLRSLGYKAIGLLNNSGEEVDVILDMFSTGQIQFIVNCAIVSEGVDVVGCDNVVLARQFGSYAQLNQVIGRAARPDSPCNVWELVNPLSGTNLDTTVIVGIPETHRLVWKLGNEWIQQEFDYVTHRTNKQLGITPVGMGMGHRVEH